MRKYMSFSLNLSLNEGGIFGALKGNNSYESVSFQNQVRNVKIINLNYVEKKMKLVSLSLNLMKDIA